MKSTSRVILHEVKFNKNDFILIFKLFKDENFNGFHLKFYNYYIFFI